MHSFQKKIFFHMDESLIVHPALTSPFIMHTSRIIVERCELIKYECLTTDCKRDMIYFLWYPKWKFHTYIIKTRTYNISTHVLWDYIPKSWYLPMIMLWTLKLILFYYIHFLVSFINTYIIGLSMFIFCRTATGLLVQTHICRTIIQPSQILPGNGLVTQTKYCHKYLLIFQGIQAAVFPADYEAL